jgi:hypothetical protein
MAKPSKVEGGGGVDCFNSFLMGGILRREDGPRDGVGELVFEEEEEEERDSDEGDEAIL